jgi:hypothetical protein
MDIFGSVKDEVPGRKPLDNEELPLYKLLLKLPIRRWGARGIIIA